MVYNNDAQSIFVIKKWCATMGDDDFDGQQWLVIVSGKMMVNKQ